MKKIVLIVSFLLLLTVYSVSAQGGVFGLNNSDPDINSKRAGSLFEILTQNQTENHQTLQAQNYGTACLRNRLKHQFPLRPRNRSLPHPL